MSTAYRTDTDLPWNEFWANLPPGLTEDETAEFAGSTRDNARCLTNGQDWLWCFTHDGTDTSFERYGGNEVEAILEAIDEHFGCGIVGEHDEGFFDEEDEE